MKVLHLSTSDVSGGAALAAYRLHRAILKSEACDSSMLVLNKKSQDPTVSKILPSKTLAARFKRRIESSRLAREHAPYSRALSQVELFSDDRGAWTDAIAQNLDAANIIQLHWVSQFLEYGRFFSSVPNGKPLVWRLADMNPLTGGCHYDGNCGRFTQMCGRCPQLQSAQDEDLSRAIWRRKKAALDNLSDDRLHMIALNQWMAGQIKRSSLFSRFQCSVIPNGVDLNEFRPVPPGVAREALGVPADREVLAFVAESAGNVRKGFQLLCQALGLLKDRPRLFLLVVGDSERMPRLETACLRVGFVQSPVFLRQIYSAADLFIIPSLEDNQPNTVLEAMACGTPVAGFNAGGIPEMIEHSVTGLLAPAGDVSGLAEAIELLLDDQPRRVAMGANARRRAETAFSRDTQVRRYLELYARLLEGRGASEKVTVGEQKHAFATAGSPG